MSVAKVTEITSSSTESFDHAIKSGIKRASETVQNIESAWVADQSVRIKDGEVTEYQVRLKLTFVIN